MQRELLDRGLCVHINVRIDDTILERVKPYFKGADEMQLWIEQQLQQVLIAYTNQVEQKERYNVEKEELLKRVNELQDGPKGLSALFGILGNPGPDFSWKKLRDEALAEKYGI